MTPSLTPADLAELGKRALPRKSPQKAPSRPKEARKASGRVSRHPLAKLLTRSHGSLVRAVLEACNRLPGVELWAVDVGGAKRKHGTPGVADIVGWVVWHPGGPCARFVALEIKTGRDRLRPSQRDFLERVRVAGGIGIEVRRVEDAVEALR